VDDFLRRIHAIALDADALAGVAGTVAALADAEGLAAHAESVRMRLP
jgi:histidinol dehydrogenase